VCSSDLDLRKDDDPAVVAERLRVYHSETAPVVEYYRSLGTLHEVDGEQTPDAVFADLRSRIGAEA
jgi:adenylate kinase